MRCLSTLFTLAALAVFPALVHAQVPQASPQVPGSSVPSSQTPLPQSPIPQIPLPQVPLPQIPLPQAPFPQIPNTANPLPQPTPVGPNFPVLPGGTLTPGLPAPTTQPQGSTSQQPDQQPDPNAVVVVLNSRVSQKCYAPKRCTSTLQGIVKNNTRQLVYSVGVQSGSREGGRNMTGGVYYLPTPTLNPGTAAAFSLPLPLELSNNAARVIRVFWQDQKGTPYSYEPQFVAGRYSCGANICDNASR